MDANVKRRVIQDWETFKKGDEEVMNIGRGWLELGAARVSSSFECVVDVGLGLADVDR
jgi:hypothetical protein